MKCNQFSSLVGMDLGEFQTTIRHLASQQPSSDSETDEEPHMQAETYHVHCRLCSNYLCELSDIRRYMKSYYLVLNPNLHEKVDLKSLHNSFMKFFDGKFCEGFLVCCLSSFIPMCNLAEINVIIGKDSAAYLL